MISILLAFQIALGSVVGAEKVAPTTDPCALQRAPAQTPFAGNVMFICWSRAVSLGKADRFSSSYNSDNRTTAVSLEANGTVRVVLVSPTADYAPQVEDVTRDLAKLAGRYSEAGLDGLDVDLAKFGEDGTLSLSSAGGERRTHEATDRSIGAALPVFVGVRVLDTKPFAKRAAAVFDHFDEQSAVSGTVKRPGQ
jgi:hypothetical protein